MGANLKGVLPDRATQVIAQLQSSVDSVKTQVSSLAQKPTLSPTEAEKRFGAATMALALSAQGSNPLNTSGLLSGGLTGDVVISGTTLTFRNGILVKHSP